MSAILEETKAVTRYRDGREVCNPTAAGKREYALRRERMWARDNGICMLCGFPVDKNEAVFAHKVSRGGGKRDDREEVNGIAHPNGNLAQGSISYIKYMKRPLYERIMACRGSR